MLGLHLEHELAILGGRIDCSSFGLRVERGYDQYYLILLFMTGPVPSIFPSWIQSIPLEFAPI